MIYIIVEISCELGAKISRFCVACGERRNREYKFCSNCGNKFESEKLTSNQISIAEIINDSFEGFEPSGSQKEIRTSIQRKVFETLSEISIKSESGSLFTEYDPETGSFDVETSNEFLQKTLPQSLKYLVQLKTLSETNKPYFATFLNFVINFFATNFTAFASVMNNYISNEDWHQLNLNMLKDFAQDMNASQFSTETAKSDHIQFYETRYPEKKIEFVEQILRIPQLSPKGSITTDDGEQDRKEFWELLAEEYQSLLVPKVNTLEEVIQQVSWLSESFDFLKLHCGDFLKNEFLALFQCTEGREGKPELLFVTNNGTISIMQEARHRKNSVPMILEKNEISHFSIGSDVHESYGMFVLTSIYWFLQIYTKQHQIYTKYIFMGKDESELNETRPVFMGKLEQISKFYEITEAGDFQSSSGIQITPSIGFWRPL